MDMNIFDFNFSRLVFCRYKPFVNTDIKKLGCYKLEHVANKITNRI